MELNSTNERPNGVAKPDDDFNEVIEASKRRIQETAQVEPKVKSGRGPGRPKKIRPAQASPQAEPTISAPETPLPSPNISGYLKAPLMAVSKIPAVKTGIPEMALSSEEAEMCAESLNQVLHAFAPSLDKMSPQSAAILGACMTFGSIGFQKYQIYQLKMAEKKTVEKPPEIQDENRESQKDAGISVESYFPTRGDPRN